MHDNLKNIFSPKSIAFFGATAKKEKWGYRTAKNILESSYEGKVYFINPSGGEVLNKKIHSNVLDIAEEIDVALVAVPIKFLKTAVNDCAKKRVKGIIVVTTGLGEVNTVGMDLQNELVEIARKGGSRIIGPNCMGIISNPCKLNLTSSYRADQGSIGFVSQSGNLGIAALNKAQKLGIGFSYFFSIGNQADIQFGDCLEFLMDDPYTNTILLYMEGVPDVRKFLEKAQEAATKKPIIIYKAGSTQAGSRSAFSHTGSIAGKDYLYDAAFKQIGLLRLKRIDEILQVADTLNCCPALKGNNVVLIGGGGGHATTVAEATERLGLTIPTLSENMQTRAREILTWKSAVKNPIDFAGAGDGRFRVFDKLVDLCFKDPTIDGAIIFGAFGGYLNYLESPGNSYEDVANEFATLVKKYQKPIIVQTIFAEDRIKSIETLKVRKIPVNESAEITAKCMATLRQHSIYIEKLKKKAQMSWQIQKISKEKEIFDKAIKDKRLVLLESEIRELFDRYGIKCPRYKMVKNRKEAIEAAEVIGYPVALKIISSEITHKTDINAVEIGLNDRKAVETAYDQITANVFKYKKDARLNGMGVYESLPKGLEIIIGAIKDEDFGPVIMFGIGGIFVEVLKDVTFRILPITASDAHEMLEEIKCSSLLAGARSKVPVDREAIVDTLLKVSRMVTNNPHIKELDINPLVVFQKGLSALDARVLINQLS
jgi:acetyltransferase